MRIFLSVILLWLMPIDVVTLRVRNIGTARKYIAEAEVSKIEKGYEVRRLFINTATARFTDCDLDADFVGTCDDEQGKSWEFEGGK